MDAALFALVDKEHGQVFAWGMEITVLDDPETEDLIRSAVVYRPGPPGEQNLLSTHDSAEAARDTYRRVLPVELEWDADLWYEALSEPLGAGPPAPTA